MPRWICTEFLFREGGGGGGGRWREVEGGRENPILGRVKRLAGLRRCHPVNFTLSKTINLGSNEISLWRQVGHHVMLTHQSDGPRPPWLLPLHI